MSSRVLWPMFSELPQISRIFHIPMFSGKISQTVMIFKSVQQNIIGNSIFFENKV